MSFYIKYWISQLSKNQFTLPFKTIVFFLKMGQLIEKYLRKNVYMQFSTKFGYHHE